MKGPNASGTPGNQMNDDIEVPKIHWQRGVREEGRVSVKARSCLGQSVQLEKEKRHRWQGVG
jgi:hypothetical protein